MAQLRSDKSVLELESEELERENEELERKNKVLEHRNEELERRDAGFERKNLRLCYYELVSSVIVMYVCVCSHAEVTGIYDNCVAVLPAVYPCLRSRLNAC